MTEQIIKQIWTLPWYKVMKIAFMDDVIFLVKIWPVLIILFLIALLYFLSLIKKG